MPRGSWLSYLRVQAGAEIPAGLRLIVGALSGAALSLSYTGLYLSIYSWLCIGILLFSLFGARARVASSCGFLHGLLFVLTSVPWIATVLAVHGGLSVAGGWGLLLLIAITWGILTGAFAWTVHRVSLQSIELACIGAPFIWVTFEFVRAHLPEISFRSSHHHHGYLRTIISCSVFQRIARMDEQFWQADASRAHGMRGHCYGDTFGRHAGRAATCTPSASSSFRPCRSAQFPGGGLVRRGLVPGACGGP